MNRTDAVSAGLILVCGGIVALAGRALAARSITQGMTSVEGFIGAAISVIGVVAVVWWVLTLLVAIASDLVLRRGPSTAARLAQRCTPAVMRRLAAALVGINLVAVPAVAHGAHPDPSSMERTSASVPLQVAQAHPPLMGNLRSLPAAAPASKVAASPSWSPVPVAGTSATGPAEERAAVSPGWKPAPMPTAGGMLAPTPMRSDLDGVAVVVVPGDSLWSIVERHLGPLSTAADVAEAWPAWYDTNRTIIGEDPSLLLPGQVLRAPRT